MHFRLKRWFHSEASVLFGKVVSILKRFIQNFPADLAEIRFDYSHSLQTALYSKINPE